MQNILEAVNRLVAFAVVAVALTMLLFDKLKEPEPMVQPDSWLIVLPPGAHLSGGVFRPESPGLILLSSDCVVSGVTWYYVEGQEIPGGMRVRKGARNILVRDCRILPWSRPEWPSIQYSPAERFSLDPHGSSAPSLLGRP